MQPVKIERVSGPTITEKGKKAFEAQINVNGMKSKVTCLPLSSAELSEKCANAETWAQSMSQVDPKWQDYRVEIVKVQKWFKKYYGVIAYHC